jgi:hypothetical protein
VPQITIDPFSNILQFISEEQNMSSEFNELLPVSDERAQLWIIGTRDQVIHLMNELYVRKVATDFPSETLRERVQFTPIIPAPFASGKYMTVLVR